MVKLLDTAFGNYGFILDKERGTRKFPATVPEVSGKTKFSKVRTSVYDARFLRTTDLSKGSVLIKVSDPQSYAKHGLLHSGQEMLVSLENPLPTMINRRTSSHPKLPSHSVESRRTKTESKNSSAHHIKMLNEKQNENLHAGRSTVVRHHKGFAVNFAANRSLANYIGDNDEMKEKNENDDNDEEEEDNKKNKLITLDLKRKPLTKLNQLKTKRLHNVYSDMYEKMDKQRRSLIMERVQTAEKIKNDLRQNELEDQRKLLKSSIEAQRKQLQEVRTKHVQDFNTRLHSLYTPKSSKVGYKAERKKDSANNSDLHLSLPRNTYGLPESDNPKRPETVPSKHIYRFRPGKLLLASYDQTKSVMPTKFNNVWTKVTLTNTPQKAVS